MADPRAWQIITALDAALSDIRIASGYLTDAGMNVWTEPAQRTDTDALGISIMTTGIARMDGERPDKRGRILTLALEAAIPATQDNAHQLANQLIEDLEVALASFTTSQQSAQGVAQALPVSIGDITVLDRPEGLAVIGVHVDVSVGYWR